MSKTAQEYITEASSAIAELGELKADLYSRLSGLKVQYSIEDNLDLTKAIEAVFGDEAKANKGYITLDMYLYCLKLVRAAGKAKAQSLIGNVL